MNKIRLWAIATLMVLCGANTLAIDYTAMKPLKLVTPEMTPTLNYGEARTFRPELETLTSYSSQTMNTCDHAPWAKENWTWMRSNPDAKPYEFMDDLTFVGVPLFVAGIIAKSEKHAFRQNDGSKHVLLTDFKTGIDDYLQFFGPAMTVGLKIGGVEGRSDWGRLLASSAMAYGIMAAFVNSIKYTAKEMRPDGTSANSWPSGHTATAFVGATILHKEYGLTRSPWYSIAAYGTATATGVMRVLNNRHWISDVLSGAGIGIMSGELAYALSDIIFKDKGVLNGDAIGEQSIINHPSFFSISMGIGFGSRNMDFDMQKFALDGYGDGDNNFNLKFGASTAVAAEGAYFFNKYIGIGGRLRVNSSPIKGWDGIERYAWGDMINSLYGDGTDEAGLRRFIDGDDQSHPLVENAHFIIKSDHLTEFSADLGLYFNLPLSNRFALGSKLLVGRSIMQEIDLNAVVTGGRRSLNPLDDNIDFGNATLLPDTYTSEWDYFTVGANNTMKFGTGLSLTYAYKDNFAWRVFVDYDYSRKTYTMTYDPARFVIDALGWGGLIDIMDEDSGLVERQSIKKNRHTFVLGGSFAINF